MLVFICSLLSPFWCYLASCWVIWVKPHTFLKISAMLRMLSFRQFQVRSVRFPQYVKDKQEYSFICWLDYSAHFKFLTVYHSLFFSGFIFWPVFLISNIASLIASRAMTTATFTCIKQSIALGCFPRLKIIHTSKKFIGQIYIPVLNWFLLVVCLIVICSISNIFMIGNAYGNIPFS